MTNIISPSTLAGILAWICLGICAICTMEAAILCPLTLLGTTVQKLFIRTGLYLFLLVIGPLGYLALLYVAMENEPDRTVPQTITLNKFKERMK